jgi:hypothetical protein
VITLDTAKALVKAKYIDEWRWTDFELPAQDAAINDVISQLHEQGIVNVPSGLIEVRLSNAIKDLRASMAAPRTVAGHGAKASRSQGVIKRRCCIGFHYILGEQPIVRSNKRYMRRLACMFLQVSCKSIVNQPPTWSPSAHHYTVVRQLATLRNTTLFIIRQAQLCHAQLSSYCHLHTFLVLMTICTKPR